MPNSLLAEFDIDQFRKVFNKYTKKAFEILPKLENPRILDIGCGSGVPTIELAKWSNGEVIGLDIDQALLDKLNKKIEEEGLSNRVITKNCSLFKIDFPDETFDIIWAEGAIALIGFKKGLLEWKRLLEPNGFLVVHDGRDNLSFKLKKIPQCGYKLVNHFSLPEEAWWIEYYQPLEIRINELRLKHKNDPKASKIFQKYQKEIDMAKNNPQSARSVFIIMQKI